MITLKAHYGGYIEAAIGKAKATRQRETVNARTVQKFMRIRMPEASRGVSPIKQATSSEAFAGRMVRTKP